MMKAMIPQALKLEHQELHAELLRATETVGKTGEAARRVAQLLHPHFAKEEEFALPPLGMLMLLETQTPTAEEARRIIELTDRLKAEMPRMMQEHKTIVAALMDLVKASKAEKKTECMDFAERLMLHAQTEEEVLYPAALLVGEYLKLKLSR
jgi:hypothetical protein